MTATGTAAALRVSRRGNASQKFTGRVVIGKDVLELVSGAMYVEPLTIVREYVQNAVDAIDEAEANGQYLGKTEPRVDVIADVGERKLTIRDTGIGVKNVNFARRLTAFGGSRKRGTRARGFRGVGRLAGLGYCQELVFRSRSVGDAYVMELSWDARRFKEILLDPNYTGNLDEVIRDVASITTNVGAGYPKHFFEVELRGVTRNNNDVLLNEQELQHYLAQIAPVPFHPAFRFGERIDKHLNEYGLGRWYNIYVSSTVAKELQPQQIYRPHRSVFTVSGRNTDHFIGVDLFEWPGVDGGVAAVGWVLDHRYFGAIAKGEGIKGLRLRSGNIQIGGDDILAESFPEVRFNSWMIGEIHVLSPKLIPNGRRDALEQNAHFVNLQGHVAAYARSIAKACREKSKLRNQDRRFLLERKKLEEKLSVMCGVSLPRPIQLKLRREVTAGVRVLEKLVNGITDTRRRKRYQRTLNEIKFRAGRNLDELTLRDPLARLPKAKQSLYRQVIGLIFECAPSHVAAGALVERMLAKLAR